MVSFQRTRVPGISSSSEELYSQGIGGAKPRVAVWGRDLSFVDPQRVSVLHGKCHWVKDVPSCVLKPSGDAVWFTGNFFIPALHESPPEPLGCPERNLPNTPHFFWSLKAPMGAKTLQCKHRNCGKRIPSALCTEEKHCLPQPRLCTALLAVVPVLGSTNPCLFAAYSAAEHARCQGAVRTSN